MRLFHRMKSLFQTLFGKAELDEDLDEELASYLEMLVQEKIRSGTPPARAYREARLEFGGVEQVKEKVREERLGFSLDSLFRDVRHTFRGLRKRPVFYATVLLVFALGIGANTVIFSVVNGVLLRPLPYPEPDRLVSAWQTHPNWLESDNPSLRAQWDHLQLAYPVYEDWRAMSPVFQDLGIYASRTFIVTGGERPERIGGARATRGVFGVLGIDPILGRTFLESEDRPGGPGLVVLSYGIWMERFGGDREVLGRTMVLNESSFTIVGVMPRGFSFPEGARLWTTFPDSDRERERNSQFANGIARLKPGVSLATAQREMEALQDHLHEVHPIPGRHYGVNLVNLHDDTVGDVRSALTLLFGSVGIFLVIACANIASLLLLRAAERRKELAVRLSLGASKKRLVGQLLTEGVVLSALGGGLGLLLAVVSLGPFLSLLPPGTPRLESVSMDGSVLAFFVGLSTLTGLLVGVVPGSMASNTKLISGLNESGRGSSRGSGRNRIQFALLVGEVAMTFVLLAGAGLLTRSFSRLTAVNPGFSSDGVVVMRMDLRGERYAEKESIRQAYGELMGRLRALPGVSEVSLASPGPFRSWWSNGTTVDTGEGFVETNTQQESVSANYFEMMEIPLLAGRTFTPDEIRDEAPVIVVNEAMERAFWPETGALGQRVKLGRAENRNPWLVVVGVVGDVRRRLEREPYTTLFHPLSFQGPAVLMKTAGDPSLVMVGARQALRAVDPQVPISGLETLDAEISRTVAGPRVRTMLLGSFSLFGTLLAVLGIFSLLAHAVSQRTNEIGIRMALGAEKRAVLRDVIQRGLGILALGLGLGLLVTFIAVRALEPFLFHVGRSDPGTLAGVALLLSVCTLVATVIPARRAMGVDPAEALRSE